MSTRFARLVSTAGETSIATEGDIFLAMAKAIITLPEGASADRFEVSPDVRQDLSDQADRDVRDGLVVNVLLDEPVFDLRASFKGIPIEVIET